MLEAGGQKGPLFIKSELNKLPFFSNRPIASFACAPPHLQKRCMLGSQCGSKGGARGVHSPPPLFLDQTKARPEGRDTCIARAHTDLPKNPAQDLALTYMLYFN